MGESGSIAFDGEGRGDVACAVAGSLAESGVGSLEVSDPRACRSWTLKAREADLPKCLVEAAPGTTFRGDGVALLVCEREIQWVADETVAPVLRAITSR
jgi:hypothetical protein